MSFLQKRGKVEEQQRLNFISKTANLIVFS